MNVKRAVFAILVGGLVLTISISRAVVDTSRIETLKGKNVLTQQDLQIIDEFMEDAVNDIVRTTNFTEVAKTRTIVLQYKSTQAQYANQYAQSAYTHISKGLQDAQDISDPNNRFKVMANLLILIDSLEYPRLVDLAVAMIPHESGAVRYWAIRAATNPGVWAQLGTSQASAAQLAGRILTECSRVAATSSPEALKVMVDFASRQRSVEAEQLLVRVADVRIASYADWSVHYELVDMAVLKGLCEKLTSDGTANPETAKRFAQLYSFVIQRYIKGQQQGVVSEVSRNYLASVIAEVENKCLGKLLGTPQATLTLALQQNDLDALRAEHDKLLGGGGQAGTLVAKFSFSYGSADNRRSEPVALPDPPRRKAVAETASASLQP